MIYNSPLAPQDFHTKPLFISIPHSGEELPPEAIWLLDKDPQTLLCDVDRFVHKLYLPVIKEYKIPSIYSSCHRYALDLNRLDTDISAKTVKGIKGNASTESGLASGLYWTQTTKGEALLSTPLEWLTHKILIDTVYYPFHNSITEYQNTFLQKFEKVYHLDLHSMPSWGTAAHRDNGSQRPEIVVSDMDGTSCSTFFVNLVKKTFNEHFEVVYNWPYKGGGVTRKHGNPDKNCHTIQIEIRRDLYMNEDSKELLDKHSHIQTKLQKCIAKIYSSL